MKPAPLELFDHIDAQICKVLKKYGEPGLRYALGIVFIWFGALKPLGVSPAAGLVARTCPWWDPTWFVPFLGWWEVLIGVCLLYRPAIRIGLFLMAVQMVGTFLPMILLPSVVYQDSIFHLTLEGQYIIKNLVLVTAAMVVGSNVRKECKTLRIF